MKKKQSSKKLTFDKDHLLIKFCNVKLICGWLDDIANEYEEIALSGQSEQKSNNTYTVEGNLDDDETLTSGNNESNYKFEYDSSDELDDSTSNKTSNYNSLSDSDKKQLLDEINYAVSVLSREIYLDKSYVIFPENKHSQRYVTEEDWNSVVEIVKRSDFCKKITKLDCLKLQKIYMNFIITYIYSCLQLYGYDIYELGIKFEKTNFIVEFYYDDVQEWKYYKGKWQDWEKTKN